MPHERIPPPALALCPEQGVHYAEQHGLGHLLDQPHGLEALYHHAGGRLAGCADVVTMLEATLEHGPGSPAGLTAGAALEVARTAEQHAAREVERFLRPALEVSLLKRAATLDRLADEGEAMATTAVTLGRARDLRLEAAAAREGARRMAAEREGARP